MHTRPTWAEVSLRKLAGNFKTINTRISPGASVCAVVKAEAYGHGAVDCARALQQTGAEWFGVASVEEGVQLREAGIQKRILVMGGIWEGEADAVLQHRLTPTVWEAFHLDWLEKAAGRLNVASQSIPVHLEIDTGMSRQGVLPNVLPMILDRLTLKSPLRLEGIYSHFASSEIVDAPDVPRQLALYQQAVKEILRRGHTPAYSHFANSAAIVTHPETWKTHSEPGAQMHALVRPGLALYGYCLPLTKKDGSAAPAGLARLALQPVLSWKTRIVSMRQLPAGQAIGYNGTYVTKTPSLVASIPVGYGDGLSRRLSNRGDVLVRGARAPILGNVSMDITTVDVTRISGAAVGDEVVLIGEQQGAQITAEDQASAIGTIPYEVLCNIGQRVPRVYQD